MSKTKLTDEEIKAAVKAFHADKPATKWDCTECGKQKEKEDDICANPACRSIEAYKAIEENFLEG